MFEDLLISQKMNARGMMIFNAEPSALALWTDIDTINIYTNTYTAIKQEYRR